MTRAAMMAIRETTGATTSQIALNAPLALRSIHL